MPGRSPLGVRRSLLWAEPGLAARPLPGQLPHESVAQTFELRSQMHRVLRALGRELVRSDAAPLQAQLEQGGGPKVCGTAAQGMSPISKRRGVDVQRRGFELLDQLFSIGDEVADQVSDEIVAVIQLAQPVQVREIERRPRLGGRNLPCARHPATAARSGLAGRWPRDR